MSDVEYQMQTDSSRAGAFLMGVMWGAAVGAALGVMFAPKRGSEFRRQLAQSADRLRRRTSNMYDDASQVVNEAVSRGKRAVQAGKEAFQQTPFRADTAAESRFVGEGGHEPRPAFGPK